MHILVTGGCGFIGSNFIHYWRKEHPLDRITNIDALTYAGNPQNLAAIPANDPTYRFIHASITDQQAVHEAFEGVDVVVHFAAETHVDRSILGSRVFLETNVLGTHTLLEEALKRKNQLWRFHHISTDEVFGSLPLEGNKRFTETTPYAPRSPYSASKAAADHLVMSYVHTHKLPITISNCSNNYGPYLFPEKFIPLAITNLMQDKPIPVYGKGLNVRDWLHVSDHCRAIDTILHRGAPGQSYAIGADEEHTNIEVAHRLLKAFNLSEETHLRYVEDRKGHDLRYAIDYSKLEHDLDWRPTISFDQGLTEMIAWYRENEAWWRPLLPKQLPS